jgi:hypothetical protein
MTREVRTMKGAGIIGLILIGMLCILPAAAFADSYTPVHFRSERFGGTGTDEGYSVAVDASGNIFVAGAFKGTVDFGGGNRTSAGLEDVFLAKYTNDGAYVSCKRYGGTDEDIATSMVVDRLGNVSITGYYEGVAYFGGQQPCAQRAYRHLPRALRQRRCEPLERPFRRHRMGFRPWNRD